MAGALVAQEPAAEMRWQLEEQQLNPGEHSSLEFLAENSDAEHGERLRVNFATALDWEQLGALDIFQISNLLQYREATGMIYSAYELLAVKGFDRQLIEALLPRLDFSTESTFPQFKLGNLRHTRHELILRWQQDWPLRQGFRQQDENAYLGPPFASYLRYRARYRDLLEVGLAVQNDAGEPWGGRHQRWLTDHQSAFVSLKNYGPVEKLVLGDYQISYGQGLALWSGGGLAGPGRFASVKRYGRGITAYAGAQETRYLRGMALAIRPLQSLGLEVFLSNKGIDASAGGSLQESGLHRNNKELESKNRNRLNLWGTRVNWRKQRLQLNFALMRYQFARAIPVSEVLYRSRRFSGDELTNYSLNVNYLWRNFSFFGEVAADGEGHLAMVGGLESLLADGLHLGLSIRSVGIDYKSLYSAAPVRRDNAGERGLYLGLDWELSRYCHLKAVFDHYYYPWISFRADAPYSASAQSLILHFPINRAFVINLQLRMRGDMQNGSSEKDQPYLIKRQRVNLRLDIRKELSQSLWLAWRIEQSRVEREQEITGLLFYQDFGISLAKKWDLKARLAFVDVPDYAARIYAYEHDLLYRFSIPAYYGHSFRSYLLCRWQLHPKLGVQGRVSFTSFNDRDIISSGTQEVDGNQLCSLALQLRWKL